MIKRLYILLLILLVGCTDKGGSSTHSYDHTIYAPRYASGFEILGSQDSLQSTILRVLNPWQGADGISRDLFIARAGEVPPEGFSGEVISHKPQRVACMSSSHIAIINHLGEVECIKGVSGKRFVSNPRLRAKSEQIADIGYDGNVNYELLLAKDIDLILLYGVFGPCAVEPKLKELGIPFVYVGEYVEQSPLGKAEWMVALGEIFDCRKRAEELFSPIEQEYERLRELAQEVAPRPKVMLNTPYGDSWYMPSTSSYIAQLLRDAGGDYIYSGNSQNLSATIDMEQAIELTAAADVWLDVANIENLDALVRTYPRFAQLECVANGRVYDNDLTDTDGANDYWESGVIEPHIILADLISILHPDLIDHKIKYYRQL